MTERAEHLVRLRRSDSQAKASRVLAALAAMAAAGDDLAVAAVARRSKVSRRFIYDHPELRAELTRRTLEAGPSEVGGPAGGQVTLASLRADLANAREHNRRLETQLSSLKRRLGQSIGAEVTADVAAVSAAEHEAVAARLAATEETLVCAREQLARCEEELAAARQINRDLMARLNRGP